MVWKTLHLLSALVIITGSESVHITVKEGNETYNTIICALPQTVQVLSVTNTTCKIMWNKPIYGDENLSYDIVISKDGKNVNAFSHTTSDMEISFTIPNLEPGSKYNITLISTVYSQILTQNSTNCITEPDIGKLTVINVTNTTCTIFWKKPINTSESVRYFTEIFTIPSGSSYRIVYYSSSLMQPKFIIKNLNSGRNYVISVSCYYPIKDCQRITTLCSTKSAFGTGNLTELISKINLTGPVV
ncbi:receptor-type tyrosine-protein phosphatase eta-like [Leptopilina heterotoma]|uniref:receptor-type tyrosine-protein phosphatase eta-like n=1 Tax=Leptopilina heterotoma TaxID=63436 RepID=UPI001CA8BE06|nr:receptor-type tyrosine-protein phosphatase eta-like [Leptopilina heterotoma]